MAMRLLVTCVLSMIITLAATARLDAQETKPAGKFSVGDPRDSKLSWVERNAKMNERVKQGNVDYIFVGDSITQGWERSGKEVWDKKLPKNSVNLGIGGDQTQHVIWRLENGNIDGISPKVAVLMIGTNNLRGADASANTTDVAEGVATIIKLLRTKLPDTKILVYGIFPRGEKVTSEFRSKILQCNQFINKLEDGKMIFFRDIGCQFIDDKGTISKEIMPDFLHLTPKGYEIWGNAIVKHLEEIK